MYKIKISILLIGLSSLSACQIITPIFVDYNGTTQQSTAENRALSGI